ncbi:Xylose operon regulatory protein [Planctomycetes bacterium CA13]|uniref:Xylose operon regulatory protein n=1 Tax=Novipirellula herctigrandis TaxID=2527986 RepID=A0A5C5YXY3_9BACT|nr:Xylose operon regulatory protein [Planctomycetes bacterium CA13]
MLQKYRVVLLIETSSGYGRETLQGIMRFLRTHHDWSVFLELCDVGREPPKWLFDWNGHGIISRLTTPELADAVKESGIAMVDLSDRRIIHDLPSVRTDNVRVGEMAADYLIKRGFRSFAYCGFENEQWSTDREKAFVDAVTRHSGVDGCEIYRSRWFGESLRSWEDQQAELITWLGQLAKPVAVFCANDGRAQHVLEACSRAELLVPEEVAVLGVDNDSIIGPLCDPTLSSIEINPEEVGFVAAELLSQLMMGKKPESIVRYIQPISVETRQSTDVKAIADPLIASARAFIHENSCNGITVQSVTEHCGLSRSTLERQFRKLFDRSPQQEIRHVQIKRARKLLAETDLSMERIANLCGFDHPEYMHVVFRREIDMTPGQYRRQSRAE